MDAKNEALEQARELIGNIVSAAGPYPYVNNTELVKDAYKLLGTIDAALRTQIIGPVWVKELDRLRAEVASLKEHNEHLLHETVKMAADVAAIQREHDVQKTRLYAEKRALTRQLADSEATVKSLWAALEHTENTLIEVSGQVVTLKEQNALLAVQGQRYFDVLQEIALAGMSTPMGFTEEEAMNFQSGQAWRFISTAARAITEPIDAAISAQEPKQ